MQPAVRQTAVSGKQYSTSPSQSEDELETQAPPEHSVTDSAAALQWNVVEQPTDFSHVNVEKGSNRSNLWTSAHPLLTSLASAALLAAFTWILRSLRRKPLKQQQQSAGYLPNDPEPTLCIYASDFSLEPRASSPRQVHLEGVRCIVAENIGIQVRCPNTLSWQSSVTG